LGEADRLVEDDIGAFREAALAWLQDFKHSSLTLDDLSERARVLYQRDLKFKTCRDGQEIFDRLLTLSHEAQTLASPAAFEQAIRVPPEESVEMPDWNQNLRSPEGEDLEFFQRLFEGGTFEVGVDGHFLAGRGQVQGQAFYVLGTRDRAPIGYALALRLSTALLSFLRKDEGQAPTPIILLADTEGQLLSRRDELMGLNGALAHLALSVDLARRHGHRLITIVRHEAVSGGFLAFGMLGDEVCALPDAHVRVMDLRAMSRVTKIALEDLQRLAQDSPVFAPGAANYEKMGAIHQVWKTEESWSNALTSALLTIEPSDQRAALGESRGGRHMACRVSRLVAEAAA
jgi:malonate decarboxylase gamma subunit